MTAIKSFGTLQVKLTEKASLQAVINSAIKLSGNIDKSPLTIPEYEGSYEIRPEVWEQSMTTKRKLMRENVRVQEIPYQEVTNLSGGKTATIGGY